ncbi:spore coat protein [Metabacillus sp. KIGAM252]|uniref:Spore coat protein n=1 Tax=Metabacillus flavus TaxID=2823519 RepID=A0ABS5LAZ6_9BACI|nr:CotY/CotZ family spore coat protein [Metabacillus flavus]MBS2967902.1 spore coat protein [Metabacillus flavus]
MGCGSHFDTGNCVCDTLAEIANAQQDDHSMDCQASCSESIRELMGGSTGPNFNTIPFQLICNSQNVSGNAEVGGFCGTVFIAQGWKRNATPSNPNALSRQTSAFFRVSSVDTENCCAQLELLCVEGTGPAGTNVQFGPFPNQLDDGCLVLEEPVFRRTGICITVDLKCFCGVSCLPAVNASSCPPAANGAQ